MKENIKVVTPELLDKRAIAEAAEVDDPDCAASGMRAVEDNTCGTVEVSIDSGQAYDQSHRQDS